MSQSIDIYQGYIEQASGFARPNRFVVNIDVQRLFQQMKEVVDDPGIFTNTRAGERLQYFCTRAELPAKAFDYFEQGIYGPSMKMPYGQRFSDVTLEFVVGNDLFERKFFDLWQLFIADPNSNDLNYFNTYTTNITIDQWTEIADNDSQQGTTADIALMAQATPYFGKIPFANGIVNTIRNTTKMSSTIQNDGTTYSITLINAWPVEVYAIPMSHDELDSYMKLAVTFAYQKWLPTSVISGDSLFPTKNPVTQSSSMIQQIMQGYSNGLSMMRDIERATRTPTSIVYDVESNISLNGLPEGIP